MTVKKELVIKSNSLINMQTDLSLIQLKVFTKIILSTVKEPNAEFYRFSVKDLLNDFNIKSSHYTALRKATEGMIKAVVLKTADREQQLSLFTEVVYENGMVDMYLHPKLKPYILDIKQRYTKYFFKSITGLNSIYSMRLYEILKQYEFRKSRSFNLEDLRFLLNISIGKYAKYTDFKKRVLLSAQKELQEKTDISFEFTEIREKRKVVRLEFKIFVQHINKQEQKTVLNSFSNSLNTILKTKLLLSDKQIKTLLKQYNEDYIKRNIDYTLSQKNIKNISWYFMKALNDDFWKSIFIKQEQKIQDQKLANKKLLQEQKQKELEQKQKKLKKEKIEQFIQTHEKEVLGMIPDFIKANSFILKKQGIDLDDIDGVLKIIKWENKEIKGVKKLFKGFVGSRIK